MGALDRASAQKRFHAFGNSGEAEALRRRGIDDIDVVDNDKAENGMTQLGGLQAGFMADWLGASLSIGLGAGFALLYGSFIALRYRQVRNLS